MTGLEHDLKVQWCYEQLLRFKHTGDETALNQVTDWFMTLDGSQNTTWEDKREELRNKAQNWKH